MLYSGFNPWESFINFLTYEKASMNLNILILTFCLEMIIVLLMKKSGGYLTYGRWAGTKIKSKKSALLATTGLGMLIFVDDYFNCLTVGSVMRPVTDRYKKCQERNLRISSIRQRLLSVLSRRSPVGRLR